MNKIDVVSLLWGAAGFLFLWAVKHFLDRAVLPRVLDWWARQTRKSALTRSEELLKLFKRDLGHASDIRYLILRVEEFVVVLVSASAIFNTGFLLLVTHPTVPWRISPRIIAHLPVGISNDGIFCGSDLGSPIQAQTRC